MPSFLRSVHHVLWLDAASCAVMGLALVVTSGPLGVLTGFPSGMLLGAGLLLLPVALLMAVAARLRPVPRGLLLVLVAGNAAWVLASLIVLAVGPGEPTALGLGLVLLQAGAVAGLAILEGRGLRAEPVAA